VVLDETAARMLAHRRNIDRYRGLLRSQLSASERDFIDRRIAEEEAAIRGLCGGYNLQAGLTLQQAD
jgi:hypothetical protein